MKFKALFLLALTFCLFQTIFAQEDGLVTPASVSGYLIGPGDEVTVKVVGEPEFDFVGRVDEDGNFQVPIFDKNIFAKCRTEKELRADVKQLMMRYLKNPLMSVLVTKRNSRPPATIYGAVKQQQQVVLTRKARLLDLIASAGGVTEKAGGIVQVTRTRPPLCVEDEEADWAASSDEDFNISSRLYSLNSVERGGEQANPIVYPGDIIVVQEALPVYIVGEVMATGKVLLPEGGLPLTQALASVGGVRREAKTKNIKIYRLKDNSKEREVILANYDQIRKGSQKDIMLEPYDIIEVDKSKKSFGEVLLDVVTGGVKSGVNTLPRVIL